ncbi:MAG: DUF3052 domain-containing protein [Gemmatimonadota bacterium]|nr:DUF3052 domain-containing protein [Gemmatimonadota bacterium]
MDPPAHPAGYSGTPLVSKLGLKPGARVQLVSPPSDFSDTIGLMPAGVKPVTRGRLDFAMLFVRTASDLKKGFPRLRDRLESNGMLWVSWPKKASGVETDLSENLVRLIGLDAGLVDVKVCAVDEVWSGLKFVRRVKDR